MFFLSTSFTGFEPDLKSGGSKWGWLRFPKGFAPSRNCSVDFWSSDLSSHCQYQSICDNTSSEIQGPNIKQNFILWIQVGRTMAPNSGFTIHGVQIHGVQNQMMHACMHVVCMHAHVLICLDVKLFTNSEFWFENESWDGNSSANWQVWSDPLFEKYLLRLSEDIWLLNILLDVIASPCGKV